MNKATTSQAEEYLEVIYRRGEVSGRASANEVAKELGVTSPAVTGMLRRLAKRGLVSYRRYRDISLTESGRLFARQLVRRHRLAERLLTDVIGLPWEKAHAEACRVEHFIGGEVETRLGELLGGISTCPHGHPLDPAVTDESVPLDKIEPPSAARVVKLADESPEVIRYLEEVGLVPGARLRMTRREPFGGPVTVETEKGERAIGRELAQKVWVEPMEAEG